MYTNACGCTRAVGGRDAEKEERQKWINRERKRIEDSVNGICFSCVKFTRKIFTRKTFFCLLIGLMLLLPFSERVL